MPPLTLEQQKDIVRRMEEGHRIAREMQVQEVRQRTDTQKWDAADRLLSDWDRIRARRTETSGFVEQQRLFAKLRGKGSAAKRAARSSGRRSTFRISARSAGGGSAS